MKSLSVFFPALNEEKNIKAMIQDTVKYLEKLKIDYEVIVINDHSTDKTGEVVKRNFNDNPHVRLVNNDSLKKGYGSALKKGFSSFTKDMVFFTDADRQFDIRELGKFLKAINKYDFVIGYRINRKDRFYRNINAWAYAMLVKFILGVHVKDLDCAFKLYRAEVIKSIDLKSDSALINAEILYKLKRHNYKFKQIGVRHYPRRFGKPTGANILVIIKALTDVFRLRFNQL